MTCVASFYGHHVWVVARERRPLVGEEEEEEEDVVVAATITWLV